MQTLKVTNKENRFSCERMHFLAGTLVAVMKGNIEIEDVNYVLHNGVRNEKMMQCVKYDPAHELSLVDLWSGYSEFVQMSLVLTLKTHLSIFSSNALTQKVKGDKV